jgi:hypothetical protein
MTEEHIYSLFLGISKYTPKELLSLWDKLKDVIRTDSAKQQLIIRMCVERGLPRFFTTSASMGVLHPVIATMLEESPDGTTRYYESLYEHLARVQGLLCIFAMYPTYYTPEPNKPELYAPWEWEGNPVNVTHLKRNKCFLTIGDAIAAAKPEQDTRLKDALRIGQVYYVPMPGSPQFFLQHEWEGHAADVCLFRRGLVYFSQDEAVARAKRMLRDD